MSSETSENGSHSESVICKPFEIQIRECQHDNLSQLTRIFDLYWQLTQKLKFSEFNYSHFSCFWILCWTSKFKHCLRSLIPDRFGPGFSLISSRAIPWREIRQFFSPFLFCMHLVWVIQKAKSALNLKSPSFLTIFSSYSVAQIGNWFLYYDVEKTCEHEVEDCIGIGSVEIE